MLTAYTSFGKNHLHFETIDSTNTFAQNLLSKSSPMDGTVISADFQTHGKGQFDRKWLSNAGENLSFSIILYPTFLVPTEQFYLSMMVAVSVSEAIDQLTGLKTLIKWPNDIYLGHHKLAGMLIVNQMMGMKWSAAVVGIGLTVNQLVFDPLRTNPTSLALASQKSFNLSIVLQSLLKRMEDDYNHVLKTRDFTRLSSMYQQKMLGWRQEVKFQKINETTIQSGTILGIDELGKLLIGQNSEVTGFVNGEIKLIF